MYIIFLTQSNWAICSMLHVKNAFFFLWNSVGVWDILTPLYINELDIFCQKEVDWVALLKCGLVRTTMLENISYIFKKYLLGYFCICIVSNHMRSHKTQRGLHLSYEKFIFCRVSLEEAFFGIQSDFFYIWNIKDFSQ